MKGFTFLTSLLLLLTVILILAEPCFIFNSTRIQEVLTRQDVKISSIIRSAKKRRQEFPLQDMEESRTIDLLLQLYFPQLVVFFKKWLRKILFTLSSFLSRITFHLKQRRTVFELLPTNDHYLVLSVFRI